MTKQTWKKQHRLERVYKKVNFFKMLIEYNNYAYNLGMLSDKDYQGWRRKHKEEYKRYLGVI